MNETACSPHLDISFDSLQTHREAETHVDFCPLPSPSDLVSKTLGCVERRLGEIDDYKASNVSVSRSPDKKPLPQLQPRKPTRHMPSGGTGWG